MPKVVIETHGCKLNMADSINMAGNFASDGFEVSNHLAESPDVFILNSCTVTHVADRKARQRLSRIKRQHPQARIVVTGCYPTLDPDGVSDLDVVDLIVSNDDKPGIVAEVATLLAQDTDSLVGAASDFNPLSALGRTRAAIKIQEGCDQVCAYCIVPKVRGRERSVPATEIVRQANHMSNFGCREIILTGTQLGNYGFDLQHATDNTLTKMLLRVLRETNVHRIRVSSLQAPEINDDLLNLWIEEGRGRLCPHFHIPLQSGSNHILRRMRRTYTLEEFADTVELVRRTVPTCSITTDIIAGFPGETDYDHQLTINALRRYQFAGVHVFPYSRRPGTSAYHDREQLDEATKSTRAKQLRDIAQSTSLRYRQGQVGKIRSVLWEDGTTGLTDNYIRARRSGGVAAVGEIEDVELVGLLEDKTMEAIPRRTTAVNSKLTAVMP